MSVAMQDFSHKRVLVTGAGSGIGKATTMAFAARGADVAICDIDENGLADTATAVRGLGRHVIAERVDVADAAAVEAFAARVHRDVEAVDVLMNNAGVALGARFRDTTLDDWQWILGINLWGVIFGCHFFVPAMVKRGRGGHVINVSSAAGFMASEGLAAYSTTKFAVFGLSEALRDELAPHGIGVTTVCPGIINTPILDRLRMRGPDATPAARARIVELYRRRNYGPDRVARNILKAIGRGRGVAPITPEAWLFYYLKRLAPGLVARFNQAIGRRMERRLRADA